MYILSKKHRIIKRNRNICKKSSKRGGGITVFYYLGLGRNISVWRNNVRITTA
ncbi:hypothetical protein BACCAP_00768 [Pseudoflavonifractor capillosus ATCC 29799]|uniref:Uncharacterized protein n=1 Tax=Pseudoflavonifractor capillosus ATCC 29799 TaxID=411467 RepID=A6NRE0_9FIRM|nr:hypothetical protein BACCAP_00768 [Pseudoflavonifractor capillosus ATCC 29799]